MVFKVRRYLPALLCVVSTSIASCGNDGPTQPEPQAPARITLSPIETTLTAVGETLRLTATVLDQEGKAVEGAAVTWTSSNPAVVSVDEGGLATALINGWVQVSAASDGVTAVASIIVMQAPARVELRPASSTLGAPGETLQLYDTVFDRNGVPIPGSGVAWTSGDDAVATVSETGLVTAVGRGSTRITASTGAVSGEASIVVAGASGS